MKKLAERLTLVLCGAVVALLALLFVILPDRAASERENRSLSQFPSLTAESFFSGDFGADINEYFSDQFPLRDGFTAVKAACELALLKGENNGVLISGDALAVRSFGIFDGKNRFPASDSFYTRVVDVQCDAIKRAHDALAEKGTELAVVVPPRSVDVMGSAFSYPTENSEKLTSAISTRLEGAGYVDTLTALKSAYENGEYVCYRTDHHWTTLGAYYAYCEVMQNFGMEAEPLSAFTREILTDDFTGTSASKSGFFFVRPDTIEHFSLPGDDFTVTRSDGRQIDGAIDREKLEGSDKYSAFLGGDDVSVTVTSGKGNPKLLMVKDSFGLSLAPFLARHFDVTLTDVSARRTLTEQADGFDFVIIVYNAENFIVSGDAAYLFG